MHRTGENSLSFAALRAVSFVKQIGFANLLSYGDNSRRDINDTRYVGSRGEHEKFKISKNFRHWVLLKIKKKKKKFLLMVNNFECLKY